MGHQCLHCSQYFPFSQKMSNYVTPTTKMAEWSPALLHLGSANPIFNQHQGLEQVNLRLSQNRRPRNLKPRQDHPPTESAVHQIWSALLPAAICQQSLHSH